MGDGSLVRLTPGQVEGEARAGVASAVKRAKVPRLAEDEQLDCFLPSSC